MKNSTEQRSICWWAHPRSLLRYIVSLDDTPHHVALGTAVGLFVGMTPTPGLQMLLVACVYYALRRLVRFNLAAGLVMTYVSNPLTALPLAWVQYQVGRLFVGGSLTKSDIEAILFAPQNGSWWNAVASTFTELGTAYLLGSVILAGACAVLCYPATRCLLHVVRARDHQAAIAPNASPRAQGEDARKQASPPISTDGGPMS